MEVAILIFDRLTALDAIGPYEVLRSVFGAKVKFVAKEPGPKRTDAGSLALVADYDPQPPFNAGSPAKAPSEIVELLRSRSRFIMQGQPFEITSINS